MGAPLGGMKLCDRKQSSRRVMRYQTSRMSSMPGLVLWKPWVEEKVAGEDILPSRSRRTESSIDRCYGLDS